MKQTQGFISCSGLSPKTAAKPCTTFSTAPKIFSAVFNKGEVVWLCVNVWICALVQKSGNCRDVWYFVQANMFVCTFTWLCVQKQISHVQIQGHEGSYILYAKNWSSKCIGVGRKSCKNKLSGEVIHLLWFQPNNKGQKNVCLGFFKWYFTNFLMHWLYLLLCPV